MALIAQCTVWLLWLRAVRVALDLFTVQETVVPPASLGHITIRNKQQPLLLQEKVSYRVVEQVPSSYSKKEEAYKKKVQTS